MKLIIVDDAHSKVELITRAIAASGIKVDITHETNAASARRRLREDEYDLLLIDLQLPDVAGMAPNRSGGVQFFDLILQDPLVSLPAEILFVTGEDSLIQEGCIEVAHRGSALCVVTNSTEGWIKSISGQISIAKKRADRKLPKFDVAVITALASELDAILDLKYGWERFRLNDDPTSYHKGVIDVNGLKKTIVAASAMRKGMAASSALATKLVLKFQPEILTMTGICAGVKDKTGLGDVVVGSPTWDWGSGKHAIEDDGSAVFKLSPKQSDLNLEASVLCDEIGRSSIFKRSVRAGWEGAFPESEFKCHVGPMASGASVIANSSIAKEISSQNRDLIGIEMEAFAVMVASEYSTSKKLIAIAIKSVCDFADDKKEDGWQKYAAYTSAQFAEEFFKQYFLK